jgi:hypothetical protein
MLPSTVHEHVGHQLIEVEAFGHEEMQTENVVQLVHGFTMEAFTAHEDGYDKHQHIDDEQVSRDCRYVSHCNC